MLAAGSVLTGRTGLGGGAAAPAAGLGDAAARAAGSGEAEAEIEAAGVDAGFGSAVVDGGALGEVAGTEPDRRAADFGSAVGPGGSGAVPAPLRPRGA